MTSDGGGSPDAARKRPPARIDRSPVNIPREARQVLARQRAAGRGPSRPPQPRRFLGPSGSPGRRGFGPPRPCAAGRGVRCGRFARASVVERLRLGGRPGRVGGAAGAAVMTEYYPSWEELPTWPNNATSRAGSRRPPRHLARRRGRLSAATSEPARDACIVGPFRFKLFP